MSADTKKPASSKAGGLNPRYDREEGKLQDDPEYLKTT